MAIEGENARLAEIRKKLSLTQSAFGEKLSLSKAQISNIENGSRILTDRVISDICREFNVSELWLREGIGEMFMEFDNRLSALSARLIISDDVVMKELTMMLWTLDVEELELIKGIIKKIKNNPSL